MYQGTKGFPTNSVRLQVGNIEGLKDKLRVDQHAKRLILACGFM